MRTKYILNIGNTEYELKDDDLKNWDEIKCSFKRESYGGVVRSFTSQFEFANNAYRMLQGLFLENGINTHVSIAIYTMDDLWGFTKQFECPLDFSSISWDSTILTVNSVDNSLAAMIKASKGTTYEFVVGSDVVCNKSLHYDRIPMMENLTYGFTQGTSLENSSDIIIQIGKGENPWVGNIGSEISVNQVIDWNDDQTTDADSYLFKAVEDIEVSFDFELAWNSNYGQSAEFHLRVRRNGEDATDAVTTDPWTTMPTRIANVGNNEYVYVGSFPDSASLPAPADKHYAIISGEVWISNYNGREYEWEDTGKSQDDYFVESARGKKTLSLKKGDEVYISAGTPNIDVTSVRFVSSKMTFSWTARGQSLDIPAMSVKTAADAILRRITGGKINVTSDFSSFDNRLANTFIIPAEVARGIANAKFYSSFNDFCGWIEAVFGYVYYLGSVTTPGYNHVVRAGGISWTPKSLDESPFSGDYDASCVIYIPPMSTFVYRKSDGSYRKYWPGWENYNNADGYPRTDTIYVISENGEERNYTFEEYNGSYLEPIPYPSDLASIGSSEQVVHFVHRSELLKDSSGIKRIDECSGVKYSLDSSAIYSSVTIGYNKKDYDSINGRDEFNFNNTYSTGCTVSDKKLSLISKYRADGYGIEFAVQSRGKDTTDTTSDKDVFFVHCVRYARNRLSLDRTLQVENTINQFVFNAAFSPVYCVKANAGYIGMQGKECLLSFASAEGNSEVVIDGTPLNADIMLDSPIATCGQLEFQTDYIDTPADENQLVEIHNGGVVYYGYIKELTLMYSRSESAKYKLIVKEVAV